jgi:hypothetical protein
VRVTVWATSVSVEYRRRGGHGRSVQNRKWRLKTALVSCYGRLPRKYAHNLQIVTCNIYFNAGYGYLLRMNVLYSTVYNFTFHCWRS